MPILIVDRNDVGVAGQHDAAAILRADRGAREDIVAQTHAALERAGALKRSPVSASVASLPQAQ